MNTLSVEFNQSLFNLSDPKNGYLSPANKAVIKNITTSIKKNKKLLLVTGDKNSGKTTLVQRAISELEEKTLLLNINHESLSYVELIDYAGNKLKDGFSSETSLEIKSAVLKSLVNKESIKHVIFLLDQPHKIQPERLVDALKLVNSTLFGSCSSHLIVTGLLELETDFKESKLAAFITNDGNAFQIQALSDNDIRSYIDFHLKQHKEKGEELFSEAAIKRIIHYSKGLPGLVNRLCNLGLLTANIEEKSVVTEEMMDEVLDNSLFLGNEFNYTPGQEEKSPEEAPPSSTLSFLPPFNQPEKAAEPKGHDLKPVFEDALLMPELVDIDPLEEIEKHDWVEKEQQPIKPDHDSQVIKMKKKRVTHSKPKNSVFASAFILGMITTSLMVVGWYLYKQKDYFFASSDYTVANSKQKTEKSLPQVTLPNEESTIFQTSDDMAESSGIYQNGVTDDGNVNPPLTEKKQEPIEGLLQLAELQFNSKKLMTPVEDSAWSTYKKILILDPSNEQAKSGILKIKETYINWSRVEVDKGNTSNAVSLLSKALQISPDDQEVLSVLLKIKNEEQTGNKDFTAKVGNDYYNLIDEPNGISKLLILAEQQIANKNLTKPINNSALSIYKLILSRHPMNRDAIMGIKKIKDTYLSWARHEIKQGDFSHAEYLYSKALEVAPSDPEVLSDLEQLRQTTGDF